MKSWWKKLIETVREWWAEQAVPEPEYPLPDVPPDVPDVPALPVPPPAATWKRENIWARPLPWKTMFVRDAGDGNTVLVSTYDRESRHNSELHIVRGNKADSALHRGDEETMGDVTWTRFIAAERGKHTYTFENGKLSSTACKLTGDTRHCVTGCIWRGRAVVAAGYGDKNPAIILDAQSGERLGQAPIKGLIAQMCEDVAGTLWLACVEGKRVLSFDGWRWQQFTGIQPASVAYWPGRGIVAGSQVDGKIYELAGSGWREIADLKCSKVNRLLVVPDAELADERARVFVAGSNPDTFAILSGAGRVNVETMARYDDEKQAVSGEQFDAGLNLSVRGVLAWRSTKKGTEMFRLVLSALVACAIGLASVGCASKGAVRAAPPGYEMDTTPYTNGEKWL